MSHEPAHKKNLDAARKTLKEGRDASARKLAEVTGAEAEWKIALRAADDEEIKKTKTAFDQAATDLKVAREEERKARDAVVDALSKWADADPAEDVKTLSAEFPLVLFPVRLETRFHPVGTPTELWVRIYPDEIMADTHEPWLTTAERKAGESYWQAYWDSSAKSAGEQKAADQEAWRVLLRQFPATRAAWLVNETKPTNLNERGIAGGKPDFPKKPTEIRPQVWTRSAEARLLPDRWIVLAYRKGQEVHRKVSALVVEPLALTINPTAGADGATDISAESLLQDPDIAWTFDFEQAEKVGMAVRIKLQPADVADGFERLLVVGVKASLDAKAGSDQLADLLEAHHHTRGLAFVRQGTPTNNTGAEPAGFPPDDPDGMRSFDVERGSLSIVADCDGHKFMTALGVPPEVAAHVAGADRTEQQAARAMNEALWPVTLGYYMQQMLAPGRKLPWVTDKILDPKTLQQAKHHFIEHVRGRGPYPAFRVGDTPYGLLPVSSLDRWMEVGQQPDPVPDLVLLHVENLLGENKGYYRVGWTLDTKGTVRGSWTAPEPISGGFPIETAGASIAIADVNGDGKPDLLVFYIESQADTRNGFYRVGWNLDDHGKVDHWSDPISVPGDFGSRPEGVGIAIADVDGDGQLDLVLLHIERDWISSPIFTGPGPNTKAHYRIGWKLDVDGHADHWGSPILMPRSGFAVDRPGGTIAIADIDGDGHLDLVVLQFMEPSIPAARSSLGYYRIGWKLDAVGHVDHWGDPVVVQNAPTGENKGADIAIANIDIDTGARPALIVFRVDTPLPGEKWNAHYQVGWNLDVTGNPSEWSDPKPVPGDFSNTRGVGLAIANISSGGWVRALRTLRELWKKSIPRVPRVGRSKNDPDRDLLESLGVDASAREVRIRTVLGGDLLLNAYHYRGTNFFNIDWSDWSDKQQQLLNDVLLLLAHPAWDGANWNPRIGEVVFDQSADLFRFPFVTGGPLSEENGSLTESQIGGYANYIDWIQQAPPVPVRNSTAADLKSNWFQEAPLLYHLLRHAMLLEYARTAFEFCLGQGAVSEKDRREPELVLLPGTDTVWDRIAQWVAAGQPATAALDLYRQSLRNLMVLPTAELERLLTETLDVCSHRLDAWITSLASKRVQEMRARQPIGSYLGAFAWVENEENLRPKSGRDNAGFVHAPSMTQAAAAAILRNGYLTRAGDERKRYAVDLSSERVRTARWLLDAVREGQPLGAVLGYRIERILHKQQLEVYIAPLRKSFPLVTVKDPVSSASAEAISARNVVDGLALRKAWPKKVPWGTNGLPTTNNTSEIGKLRKALDAELGALEIPANVTDSLMDPLDAVADLLTAESVYQIIRGNTAAGAATLDAMAQGLRPPDPEIARAPRGGTTLTHRVAIVFGEPAPGIAAGWPPATPRAVAEPYLDAWAGSLLGDPKKVKCRVSFPKSLDDFKDQGELEVSLAALNLRPLDVLNLAKGMQTTAQASELDLRVAYAALSLSDVLAETDSQSLCITYAPHPAWDRDKVSTFPEILELVRAINAVIGGARPLRPEDLLPPEAASRKDEAVWAVSDAAKRVEDTRTKLEDAKDKLKQAQTGTPDLNALRDALRLASLFGLATALPGTAKDPDPATITDPDQKLKAQELIASRLGALLVQANSAQAELERRLEQVNDIKAELAREIQTVKLNDPNDDVRAERKIRAAADGINAIFGRDFVFLVGFQPAEATPGELSRAMATGPKFIDTNLTNRANAIWKWFQGAARVRPPLDRWRKLSLYAGALGGRQAESDVVQLPYRDGEQWVALPFDSEEKRPPSGRISLALYRPDKSNPAATTTWTGLLLDEWTELIPNKTELTGVTFHYDDPGAEAAQAVLLAVPPRKEGNWDLDTLIAILHETLDLAKIRAIDGELLGALGQVLPAIVLAANTAQTSDTVSTDFGQPLRQKDGIEILA